MTGHRRCGRAPDRGGPSLAGRWFAAVLTATLLALPQAAADASLIGRFLRSATQHALFCRAEEQLAAELADSAWANPDGTLWTVRLSAAGRALGAAEIARRLRGAIGADPFTRILLRHLLTTRDAAGAGPPLGILPLGPDRLRFLLARPDPAFPARLAEIGLCPRTADDADRACGPYRLTLELGAGLLTAAPQRPLPTPVAWARSAASETPPAALLALRGAAAAGSAPIHLGFFLPDLPGYCSAPAPPPTARTSLLAHLVLLIGEELQGQAPALRAALRPGDLLPDGTRYGWCPAARLLPGPGGLPAEPARRLADDLRSATAPRRGVRLRYAAEIPVLHCLAERIRAQLWAGGWDVTLTSDAREPSATTLPGAGELALEIAVTRGRSEPWDFLRLLLTWDAPRGEALAGTRGDAATRDLLAQEWNWAQGWETRLLAEGRLLPLFVAPVTWRLAAGASPRYLRDGILPVWESPPAMLEGGAPVAAGR